MRSAAWRRFFVLLALAPALTSCISSPAQRFVGLSPVLEADAVERSSGRVRRVMAALAQDAGGGSYYDVTEAGFNYIDDRCMEYFSELFYLNRRREATKAGLGAFDKTTSAILAATGAATLTMGVIAQAFGLASNLADIAAGTYLYQLPPATTLSFVKKLQGAYREAASAKRGQINSPATAYHIIQEYLSLCLPPVIEAKLVEHVADAAASPVRGGSVSNIEIDVGTDRVIAPPQRAREPAAVQVVKAKTELPRPVTVKLEPAAKNRFEARIAPDRIRRIQHALCAPESGNLDDTTRAAIDLLFKGIMTSDPSAKFGSVREAGILDEHDSKLGEAEAEGGRLCAGGKGPFEIGQSIAG